MTRRPEQASSPVVLDRRVDDLEFSVRVANVFAQHCTNGRPDPIETLGQLVTFTEAELLRLPNFGRFSLNEVKTLLAALGLSLRGSRGEIAMTHGRRPEQALQRAVVEHLRWRARPNVWFTHIPLGGWRSKTEAAILRGLGTTRGTPDLLIVARGRAHFLELKTPRGHVSKPQHECHEALCVAGATVAVANNIDEALELLESWQILRPDVSNQIANAFTELRDNVAKRAARIRRQTRATGDTAHE